MTVVLKYTFHVWSGFRQVACAIEGVTLGGRDLLEDALVMTRLLSDRRSRSINVVDVRPWWKIPGCVGLDHCPTYEQLYSSKLHGLSQLVAGNARWAFGGCCTAVVVSLGILPHIEWLHKMLGYILSGSSIAIIGASGELLIS